MQPCLACRTPPCAYAQAHPAGTPLKLVRNSFHALSTTQEIPQLPAGRQGAFPCASNRGWSLAYVPLADCLKVDCVCVPAVHHPAHAPTLESLTGSSAYGAVLSAPAPGAAQARGPRSPRPRASHAGGIGSTPAEKKSSQCTGKPLQILVCWPVQVRKELSLSGWKLGGQAPSLHTVVISVRASTRPRSQQLVCSVERTRTGKAGASAASQCLRGQLSERTTPAASVWCIKRGQRSLLAGRGVRLQRLGKAQSGRDGGYVHPAQPDRLCQQPAR